MGPHIWVYVSAVLPTLTALLSYMKAREVGTKTDRIIIQTNGNINRLMNRNCQLAAELSKNNIEIPPPLEEFKDERNS